MATNGGRFSRQGFITSPLIAHTRRPGDGFVPVGRIPETSAVMLTQGAGWPTTGRLRKFRYRDSEECVPLPLSAVFA